MILRLFVLASLALAGCATGDALREPPEARGLHLAGRVTTDTGVRDARGVYGLRVRLLFHRAGGGWEQPLRGPDRRHRTYDTVAEDGAFRFDLVTAVDLSPFDSVAVVPSTASDAVRLIPTPRGAIRWHDAALLIDHAIRLPLAPSGDTVARDLAGTVPRAVGIVIRTAALAREFVVARYDGAPPFALPRVDVELSDRGGFVFQSIDPDAPWGHEIEVNAARGLTPALMAHEYGHYVSYRMWGANPLRYALRHRSLREGWAIFFSFAARAYAAQAYGDVGLASSNPERAPFTDTIDGGARYGQITYGESRPGYAAIGALLWSLYDVAEPSPFEYEGPDLGSLAGDNDDIGGGLAVFEAVRTARARLTAEAGVLAVVAAFKAGQPPSLGPSVDGAVGFFLCPAAPDCNVKAPADSSSATAARTLRPVAPAHLEALRVPGGVALRWDRRTYAAPWANLPDAVRVYRDGALVATLDGAASTWLDTTGAGGVYHVRSVGGGAEAAGGATARVE